MAVRTPARRRQRSVRVTVAVALMIIATVAVVAALPTRSALWLGVAAVVALLCAWAALRMMWTEVLQSRRENALDRTATATAYRDLFSKRAAEHAEFTTAMTERLAEAQQSVHELEGELGAEQERAADAHAQLAERTRVLDQTRSRLQELSAEHDRLTAEHDRLTADHQVALAALDERAAAKHSRTA